MYIWNSYVLAFFSSSVVSPVATKQEDCRFVMWRFLCESCMLFLFLTKFSGFLLQSKNRYLCSGTQVCVKSSKRLFAFLGQQSTSNLTRVSPTLCYNKNNLNCECRKKQAEKMYGWMNVVGWMAWLVKKKKKNFVCWELDTTPYASSIMHKHVLCKLCCFYFVKHIVWSRFCSGWP